VGVAVLAALVLFAFKSAWSVVDLNESRHVAVTEERPAVTPTWFGWLAILVIVSVGAGAISLFAKKLSETRLARAAVVAHPVAAGTAVPAAPLAAPVMLQPAGRLLHPRPSQLDAAPKTARRKVAEATAAMLLSAPLSVIASVLAAGIMGLRTLSESALLAATCLAGCWAVVMAGKWSEGRSGDPVLQRLLMAAMGLAVGFWNGYLDGLLDTGLFARSRGVQGWLEAPVWMPDLLAHASYFGVIFLAPNWWQLADARRSIRFNLGLVIVPCLWAWVVSWFWSAPPQTWGVVTAGLIATVAQLASPWEDRGGRRRPV
jgi:hypothetical protein